MAAAAASEQLTPATMTLHHCRQARMACDLLRALGFKDDGVTIGAIKAKIATRKEAVKAKERSEAMEALLSGQLSGIVLSGEAGPDTVHASTLFSSTETEDSSEPRAGGSGS